jgi:predicted ATPase
MGLKVLAMIEETGERWHEPEAHRLNGELLLSLPTAETGVAESAFRKAIEVARGEQAKWPELRAARGLSRLWTEEASASWPTTSWRLSKLGSPRASTPRT